MNAIQNALFGAISAVVLVPGIAAAMVVLDFEGIGDSNPVGNFYNDYDRPGTNYGVQFSNATAIVDSDARGGTGPFANEPSPDTVMVFVDSNHAIVDYAAGFSTGFSFFYSSSAAATVTVWDGLGGTGTQLGTLNLAPLTFDNCSGDPTGAFCNWAALGLAFSGTAKSIDFGGAANSTGFDNITFGSITPGIPEPSTYAMLALGLAGIGFASRSRKAV